MKSNKLKNLPSIILNALSLIFVSLFMYNAYKCISGFIANNADDGLFMITMITSYVLPVIVYLVFFYKNYVKPFTKITSIIFSSLFIVWGIFNLVNIFINIEAYATNNALGVYEALNPILVSFPYDMIIVNIIVISLQILNILLLFIKNEYLNNLLNKFKNYAYFKFKIVEYLFISVVAILAFVFVGAFFISFKSIKNVIYDPKFIFLMLWVLIVPVSTLFALVFKLENRDISLIKKNIYLGSMIGANVLFIVLLLIFESIQPNFVVGVGKPLFAITFSVSITIEMLILLGYGALISIYLAGKLIYINVISKKTTN